MAAILEKPTKKKLKRWQVVWKSSKPGEKRRQKGKSFTKYGEALAFRDKMNEEERQGIGGDDCTMNVLFERVMEVEAPHLSPSTVVSYTRNYSKLSAELNNPPISKVRTAHLDRAYANLLKCGGRSRDGRGEERQQAAQTVLHIHRTGSTIFRRAEKWGMLSVSPFRNATPPTPEPSQARSLTDDEWLRLYAEAQVDSYPYLAAMVATFMVTGMRRSEVNGLPADAVDLEKAKIDIRCTLIVGADGKPILRQTTKTKGSTRVVTIPQSLVEILRRQKAAIAAQALIVGPDYHRKPMFMFPLADGSPMHPDALSKRLKKLMRKAGIVGAQPVHSFRHTMASRAIAAGLDIVTVSARLGHTRTSTTLNMYAHTDAERDRTAADVVSAGLGL